MFTEVVVIVLIGAVTMFGAALLVHDAETRKNIAMMIAGGGLTMVGGAVGRWTERRNQANGNGRSGNGHAPPYAEIEVTPERKA